LEITKSQEERAETLHRESIVIDFHTHPIILPGPKRFVKDLKTIREIYEEFVSGRCSTNYEGLKKSGLTAYFDGLGVSRRIVAGHPETAVARYWGMTVEEMGWKMADWERHDKVVIKSTKAQDIKRAKEEGKIAAFAMEEATIGPVLDRINILYGFGVRMMGLTHSYRNMIADGCGEMTNCGLSLLGRRAVHRLNELGMIIDLSHVGKKSAIEVIELSKDPCVESHNCCKGAFKEGGGKCKDDEEMQALAEKGGLYCIETVPNLLSHAPKQGIADVMKHINYAVDLIGVDHVGIGTDMMYGDHVALHKGASIYEGQFFLGRVQEEKVEKIMKLYDEKGAYMKGIEDHDDWSNITKGLVAENYSDQEIKKIIGLNALKIIEKVIG